MSDLPPPPAGIRAGGRRLWVAVLTEYDLEEHELALLREACRTVDLLDRLDAAVRADGVIGPDGRTHPRCGGGPAAADRAGAGGGGVATARRDEGDAQLGARRPQRRVGAAGCNGIRGGAA